MVKLPPPSAPTEAIKSVPSAIVVPPVWVLEPDNIHLPLPAFRTAVVLTVLLLAIVPEISPVPDPEPRSVSVFAPAPVAVTLPAKITAPLPARSKTPPPVVPARLITRSVVCDPPVITRVPVEPKLPRSMVPFALEIGAPRDDTAVPPATRLTVVTASPPF